ncbi:hypothetical protein VM1G_07920 [Cytospora mali]|uniref:Uncharacterized protein n=1 Tax=Cytospora mali TaxID=578113 RepID=A0A194W7H7_CYTMA|nr:hypothetical protein VM1G_07920 [Valsa mali]
MPRYSGWGGGWPFMYMHQPGGWGEQTWGMGFGNRNNSNNSNNNNPFSLCGEPNSPNSPNSLNIDNLSGLFARLILQNHLTRLADIGCRGGALYGCSLPSSPSPSPSSNNHCHGGNGMNANNNNNGCQVCVHTCPNTTQPYMGTNNVFVIPATHVQQQQPQQPQQPQHQAAGLAGANLNNINMFLNYLGLALGGANISGCGGGGGVNLPHSFSLPGFGAGLGQVNLHNGGFSCAACCNHIRM